jgi:hypothetical protein
MINKLEIFTRDNFTCQKCGKMLPCDRLQVAHRIKQGKGSIKYIQNYIYDKYQINRTNKFVENRIINNLLNVATTCSLSCNSSFNIFFNPVECNKLLDQILKEVLN